MRKLVYLTIKELSPMAEDVIIVTSSLTKGMATRPSFHRISCLRVKSSPYTCATSVLTMSYLSCPSTDMTGKEDAFRASAIRALCRITDVCLLLPLATTP